jgi:FtsP/CotA-like multicopper oxidase with cupredoxin domain
MHKPCIAVALAAVLFTTACGTSTPSDPMPPVQGLKAARDHDSRRGFQEFRLTVAAATHELVPGQPAEVWAFNGLVPGPLLQAVVGDTVKVHVTNELDEPTTVHWHGLRIPVEMDGVVQDQIPAIEPGETFTYEFVVNDAGTFWYHPHVRSHVQVERGLHGMFIVHEEEATRPEINTDRAFVLDDVRLNANGSIAPFSASGMDVVHGRWGNELLLNGSSEVPEVPMGPGEIERWRLVNTANARTMTLRFPGLEVREIGADAGLWPQPMTRPIEELQLTVGARAELEVRLKEGVPAASLQSIVLTVDDGEIVELPLPVIKVKTDDNRAVTDPARGHFAGAKYSPIPADSAQTHRIELSGRNTISGVEMTVNGHAYPNVPLWEVQKDVLQIVEIENAIGPEHPFHLHGQFFQVLSRDGEPATDIGWRDTALIDGFSTIVIGTYFENPGDWMYHCHILEHAEVGMMALVRVTEKP